MAEAKKKSGKLTNMEKFAISGMLQAEKSVEDIASDLNRTTTIVQKYIDTELDVDDTVVKAKVHIQDEHHPVVQRALKELMAAGFPEHDAKDLLSRTMNKIGDLPDNGETLARLAMRNISSINLMGTRTTGGEKGVTVMTGAASAKADDIRGKTPTTSRVLRGAVHKTH